MKKSQVNDPIVSGIEAKPPSLRSKKGIRARPQIPMPQEIRNLVERINMEPVAAASVPISSAGKSISLWMSGSINSSFCSRIPTVVLSWLSSTGADVNPSREADVDPGGTSFVENEM
eukprot:CAMPEP_0194425336 /NCGR_PEP_ID=MMETSP0176-20130528/24685_1 /TAXON_ID=216777 /ORGANISM="Proboscia alata, Strain PI-D3" /LENGTH=116 /DNA_ID=CAMNT_0039235655 /DNA_START=406 /DNA_END=756 /DNA_ORIENTATION=+